MLLEAIGPPGRCRGGVVINLFGGPALTSFVTLTRARAGRGLPAATGSPANAIGRAKTAEGSRACFSPASLGAWVPKIWRGVVLVYWFRRRDAARPDRAAWRAARRSMIIGGPALTSFVTLTRARARPWSARCYGVARQRDRSRQNR